METALAFRGGLGTGKTKIGEVFGSLMRDHYLLVASLMSGMLPPTAAGINGACRRTDLYQHYVRHAQLQGASHRSIETKIGMFMNTLFGSDLKDERLTVGGQRHRCYLLPPLNVCRKLFAGKMGQTIDWVARRRTRCPTSRKQQLGSRHRLLGKAGRREAAVLTRGRSESACANLDWT